MLESLPRVSGTHHVQFPQVLGLIGGSVVLLVGACSESRKPAKSATAAKVDQPAPHQVPATVPPPEKPIAAPADTVGHKLEQALLQQTRFEFNDVPLRETPFSIRVGSQSQSTFHGMGGGFMQILDLQQFEGGSFGGRDGAGRGGVSWPDDRQALTGTFHESLHWLTLAIPSSPAPDSWDHVGGEGTIFEFRGLLVVRQTYQHHLELQRFLEELRNKHRQHPAIVGRHQPSSPDDLLLVIYDVGDHPADELVESLPEFVAPETWQSARGNGLIRATTGRLLFRQTRRVHQQLLAALDRIVEWAAPAEVTPTKPSPPANPSENQPASAKPTADQPASPAPGTPSVKP